MKTKIILKYILSLIYIFFGGWSLQFIDNLIIGIFSIILVILGIILNLIVFKEVKNGKN